MLNRYAVVICSRIHSTRFPKKALYPFAGRPAIDHLTKRLSEANLPVIVAVPESEVETYAKQMNREWGHLFASHFADCPMSRLHHAATHFDLKFVIRITHDKMLISTEDVLIAMKEFIAGNHDYLYSSSLTEGTGFEIISTELLYEACNKHKRAVEHVSFAVKALAKRPKIYKAKYEKTNHRLLLDYPEDGQMFDVLFDALGVDCTLTAALNFLDQNNWAAVINEAPEVTVYTCAYNAKPWIKQCMESVMAQGTDFPFEYIVIDDASTDRSLEDIAQARGPYTAFRWVKNRQNLGLAASSNVALKMSRGKYIIRLDADDYFIDNESLQRIYNEIRRTGADVIYPANHHGRAGNVQRGNVQHHVGGAMFDKRSLEFIRFRDELRNHEGLDIFQRAKDTLEIGYLERPLFFYRQHEGSMSKTNLEERDRTARQILNEKSMH